MRQIIHEIQITTCGRGLYDFTGQVADWVTQSGIATGLLTLFVRHTSASLLIQENYDPEVQRDLERFFARLVPDGDALFEHVMEGPDDMPAHVRSQCRAITNGHCAASGVYPRKRGQCATLLPYTFADAPRAGARGQRAARVG